MFTNNVISEILIESIELFTFLINYRLLSVKTLLRCLGLGQNMKLAFTWSVTEQASAKMRVIAKSYI